ncbi:unnamed protein product, partial [Mesorhabditis belari]|uniref:CNH domain-containing protein n=1 Tax=Mesorhabditis belari TaxID=2138241 RepID=A0AAF3J4F3_9BILA
MFEAYSAGEVGFKLPVELCSIRCQKSTQNVLAGCKEGHLLVYSRTDTRRKFDLKTLCKNFERKPVTEMAIVDSMQLLFCVSDQQLSVHELSHHSAEASARQVLYPLLAQLKLKPVHTFAVHENTEEANVLVAISLKRKIVLLRFEKNEFFEIPIDGVSYFADNPTALTWCGKNLVFSVRNEYHLLSLKHNDEFTQCAADAKVIATFTDLPFIVDFHEKSMIGLARGETLTILTSDGVRDPRNPLCREIRFSNVLQNAVYDSPFVVGLLSKGLVEIRSFDPPQLVQSITLKQAHLITNALPGCVVVGSHADIWMLDCHESLRKNVNFLIQEKNYRLAIQLTEQFDIFTDENKREIKRQYARNLFLQRQFDECFEVYSKIGAEPYLAIQMIPEVLPEKLQNLQQNSPQQPLDLPENEKKRAISALSDYLSLVRTELAMRLDAHQQAKQIGYTLGKLSKDELNTTRMNLQIVDTTLLRCYLKTKPMMVDSLLRLRDNSSSFDDTEDILKKANRLTSLFILYETRKKHEMALELLKAEAHRADPEPFFDGVYKTVDYLQTLGNTEIDLIFKYGKWVLDSDVKEGLAIFTSSDSDLAVNLDREKVVEFLRKECVAALIPYLEHIINAWGEQRPKFHECLAEHYVAKVKYLHKDYVHAFPDDENITRAGTEDGELGEYRRKLLRFLEASHSYSPQTILVQLSNQAFYEERALMLGRLGQHEQALTIYTSILHDYEAAEKYCDLYYREERDDASAQIYLQLFQAFVSPKDPQIAGLNERQIPIPQPNVKQAIRVLSRHANKINTVSALNLIPESTPLCLLSTALSAVLQTTHDEAIRCSIRRKVCDRAVHVAEEQLRKAESVKITVNSATDCTLCGKKLANSALVRDPQNSSLIHVFCYEKSQEANNPCDTIKSL